MCTSSSALPRCCTVTSLPCYHRLQRRLKSQSRHWTPSHPRREPGFKTCFATPISSRSIRECRPKLPSPENAPPFFSRRIPRKDHPFPLTHWLVLQGHLFT